MKLTAIIILLACVHLSAKSLGQNQRISVDFRNSSVKEVFHEIERISDYTVFYRSEDLTDLKQINESFFNKPVSEILDDVLDETNLSYVLKNRVIVVLPKDHSEIVIQQSRNVSGVITDSNDDPVPGATIAVKGTAIGTISDASGRYSLANVPANATLVFSFVGMKSQEIAIGERATIHVKMEEETVGIEEVIAIGYGVQKKVNLTGSVAVVDGETLSKRPVANSTASLQGIAPGLFVSIPGDGGTPGRNYTLNIRGQGTLDGTESPYVLVDGVEMDLGRVNPNDIESISVLKDASASAIYGSRAAFGVILVTTKKGAAGKLKISYQGTAGWTSPNNMPESVNSYEFALVFNQGTANTGVTTQYTDEILAQLKQVCEDPSSVNPYPNSKITSNTSMTDNFINNSNNLANTDWWNFQFKDFAFKQNHDISISGGTENTQYYVSGGYYGEEGLLQYADIRYQRYNFNSTVTSGLTSWLKFKAGTKLAYSDYDTPLGNGALNEDNFYTEITRMRPNISPYDLNGNFTAASMVPYLQSGTYTETIRSDVAVTGSFEAKPIASRNWNIFLDYTYKHDSWNNEALRVPGTFYGIDGTSYTQYRSEIYTESSTAFTRSMTDIEYKTINLYSNYSFTLGKKHNFKALAGYQEEDYNYKYLYNQVTDLLTTTNSGLELGSGNGETTINDTRYSWATRGFFGRANYDYDGKYLLEFSCRYDGSSRFASNNRWGFFPSVSAGWNIARENFIDPVKDILNYFKIRASWGSLGNQSGAGLYTFASTMEMSGSSGSWIFQDGPVTYLQSPDPIDSNVTWETVETLNAGFDFGLWNNKLSGNFDIFERTTSDMLGPSEDVADMYGADVPNTNNATMRTRGWELSLTYRGKIARVIDYSITGMIYDAQSKVLEYNNPTGTDPNSNWYAGKKVGEIWGYRTGGLLQTDDIDAYTSRYNTSYLTSVPFTAGDIRFLDLNDDDAIDRGTSVLGDMGDFTVIGNDTPRYQYSINGSITWKGLSLSMLWQGVGKRDYNPAGDHMFLGPNTYSTTSVFKEHLDYWTEENPDAYFAKPYVHNNTNTANYIAKTGRYANDYYLQDASYIRLKNLTVGYDLPKIWINRAKIDKATVFFTGENLLTFSKMIGFFDPELVFVSENGGQNYMLTKTFSLGLTITL